MCPRRLGSSSAEALPKQGRLLPQPSKLGSAPRGVTARQLCSRRRAVLAHTLIALPTNCYELLMQNMGLDGRCLRPPHTSP